MHCLILARSDNVFNCESIIEQIHVEKQKADSAVCSFTFLCSNCSVVHCVLFGCGMVLVFDLCPSFHVHR